MPMMGIHIIEIPVPLLQLSLSANLQRQQLRGSVGQLLPKTLIGIQYPTGGNHVGEQVLDDLHVHCGGYRDRALLSLAVLLVVPAGDVTAPRWGRHRYRGSSAAAPVVIVFR